MVGVDFDVLVGDLFLFEDCPDSLDERAAFGGDVSVDLMHTVKSWDE